MLEMQMKELSDALGGDHELCERILLIVPVLAAGLGISVASRLHTDASAALGIIERRGVGRVRHLDVGTLWLQEQTLRDNIEFVKIKGTINPAD